MSLLKVKINFGLCVHKKQESLSILACRDLVPVFLLRQIFKVVLVICYEVILKKLRIQKTLSAFCCISSLNFSEISAQGRVCSALISLVFTLAADECELESLPPGFCWVAAPFSEQQ